MTERGLVTAVSSRSVRVRLDDGSDRRCTLRGNLWAEERNETRPVAVGDVVDVLMDGDEGVVVAVDERRNRLARPRAFGNYSGRTRAKHGKAQPVQVIAANIDRLVIVAALNDPPFRPGLVDRFCVAADMQGVPAVLCLNKIDLPGDRDVIEPYRAAGLDVFEVSAETGEGIDGLRAEMSTGISLLLGHSGVGKSSLLNAVSPELQLAVGRVATHHGRGRHTTTGVRLVPLASGGWVVDSPGMREFALENVPPGALARLYPGFGALPERCHFSDCRHAGEPSCAIVEAVEQGQLDPERYHIYRRLLAELEEQAR